MPEQRLYTRDQVFSTMSSSKNFSCSWWIQCYCDKLSLLTMLFILSGVMIEPWSWCRELRPCQPRERLSTTRQSPCRTVCSAPWGCGPCTLTLKKAWELLRYSDKPTEHYFIYFLFVSSFFSPQTTKAVYNRIVDLKIATPQIIINFGMFLEENNYFEEAFKAYERGVALFKWPHVYDIWNTYLTKFIKRYVRVASPLC